MRNPLRQDQPKVRFRNRDNPVEAFAPNRADHALADRICLRRAQWRFQHREAQGPDRLIQVLCKDTVPVVDQVAVSLFEAHHLPQLLQGPCGTRVRRDIDACKPTATVFDHNENVEQPEGRGDRNEEITRDNRFRMVLQEY